MDKTIDDIFDDAYFDDLVPVVDISIQELEAILMVAIHDFFARISSPTLMRHSCAEKSNWIWNKTTFQLDRSGNIHFTTYCEQCSREEPAIYFVKDTEYELPARSLLMAKTGWNSFGDE